MAPDHHVALEPVFLAGLAANDDEPEPVDDEACCADNDQRDSEGHDNAQVQGADAGDHQKVGSGALDALDRAAVYVLVGAGLVQQGVDDQACDQGQAELRDGDLVVEGVQGEACKPLGSGIAGPAGGHNDAQMKAQVVQADACHGALGAGLLLFRGNQAGTHLNGQLLGVLNVVAVALTGAPVDDDHARDDAAHDTDGSAGVAQVGHVLDAHFFQSSADSGSGAVAAVEAGSHHEAEGLIQSGIELGEDADGQQHTNGVLQHGDAGDVEEHAHHLGAGHGALGGLVADGGSSEDHDDQHAGVSTEGRGQGKDAESLNGALGAEQQGQEACDNGRGDQNFLEQLDFCAQELADQQQSAHDGHVYHDLPDGGFHC